MWKTICLSTRKNLETEFQLRTQMPLCETRLEILRRLDVQLSERQASLRIMGAEFSATLKPVEHHGGMVPMGLRE